MNKIIQFTLIASILSLCFGCEQDQYAIERKYYQTVKQAEKIFQNPHATPNNELNRVVSILNKFSLQFRDNSLAVNAEFNVAQLYIVKEEYGAARAQLKKIIAKYNKFDAICSEAVFLTGKSYELENKWGTALTQYNKILSEYPVTPKGITLPIYLIQYYKQKLDPDKMRQAGRNAINHYNNLAEKYPDSPLALRAQTLAAECYLFMQEPLNAINALNDVVEKYKSKTDTAAIVLNIALIYAREIKDKAKAKETLELLIKDYPDSKLIKNAKEILKRI